jgi:DNA-damage-inducible protein J
MSAHSSMIHIRIDDDLKARASDALSAMGLTTADAVRLLFHRIAVDQAFPLELKVPNSETQAGIAEARALIKKGKLQYNTTHALFADLDGQEG